MVNITDFLSQFVAVQGRGRSVHVSAFIGMRVAFTQLQENSGDWETVTTLATT